MRTGPPALFPLQLTRSREFVCVIDDSEGKIYPVKNPRETESRISYVKVLMERKTPCKCRGTQHPPTEARPGVKTTPHTGQAPLEPVIDRLTTLTETISTVKEQEEDRGFLGVFKKQEAKLSGMREPYSDIKEDKAAEAVAKNPPGYSRQ